MQANSSMRRPSRRSRNRTASRAPIPSSDPKAYYRSVYLPVVRDSFPRSLSVFDFAESSLVIGQRETSNTPDQGLFFLNNSFVLELSNEFAKRIAEESKDSSEQVKKAFLIAYGRPATGGELESAEQFLENFSAESSGRGNQMERLTMLCQAILATAEFRIVN